jgi:hypothetical protein
LWASVLRDRGPRDDGSGMRWAVVGLRPLQPPAENSGKEDGVRKDNEQESLGLRPLGRLMGIKSLGTKIELAKDAGSDLMRDMMLLYTCTIGFAQDSTEHAELFGPEPIEGDHDGSLSYLQPHWSLRVCRHSAQTSTLSLLCETCYNGFTSACA